MKSHCRFSGGLQISIASLQWAQTAVWECFNKNRWRNDSKRSNELPHVFKFKCGSTNSLFFEVDHREIAPKESQIISLPVTYLCIIDRVWGQGSWILAKFSFFAFSSRSIKTEKKSEVNIQPFWPSTLDQKRLYCVAKRTPKNLSSKTSRFSLHSISSKLSSVLFSDSTYRKELRKISFLGKTYLGRNYKRKPWWAGFRENFSCGYTAGNPEWAR